jgi:hypothetical protein
MLGRWKVRMRMRWIRVDLGVLLSDISVVYGVLFGSGYESGRYQVGYGLAYVARVNVCI